MKKRLISIAMVAVCFVLSISSVAFAATMEMSAHVIHPGCKMTYYDGNGFSVAKGNSIYMTAHLDNSYSWSSGIQEISSNPTSTNVNNGTSLNVYMQKPVPNTALYSTWITNNTSVPMNVISGRVTW